jgi:hypothetical protein
MFPDILLLEKLKDAGGGGAAVAKLTTLPYIVPALFTM